MPVTPSAPKKLKNNFFQDKFYSLKAHAHYFTVLIYLATWRTAKLGIFTYFRSINLPRRKQSINSLMYVYYTDLQLIFMSSWSQSWSHFFVLPPPKKNSVLSPKGDRWVTYFNSLSRKYNLLCLFGKVRIKGHFPFLCPVKNFFQITL